MFCWINFLSNCNYTISNKDQIINILYLFSNPCGGLTPQTQHLTPAEGDLTWISSIQNQRPAVFVRGRKYLISILSPILPIQSLIGHFFNLLSRKDLSCLKIRTLVAWFSYLFFTYDTIGKIFVPILFHTQNSNLFSTKFQSVDFLFLLLPIIMFT